MHGSRRLAVCALLLATAGSACAKQAKTQANPRHGHGVPLFHMRSNLVLEDVVVMNHGKPVLGLPESQFRVFENGKPQRITYFKEHRATDALRVATGPQHLPPGVYSNQPRYTLQSAAVVILLDSLNTPYNDQVYIRTRLLKYLQSIPKGTRVAVFTLGGRLEMLQGFNAKPGTLERLLRSKRTDALFSSYMDPSLTPWGSAASNASVYATPLTQKQYVQMTMSPAGGAQMNMRVLLTIQAMDELGRYLSTIPGRKNLIWFTGAFPPILPGAGRTGVIAAEYDYTPLVEQMDSLLALGRVAVYPVDSRGLKMSLDFRTPPNINPGKRQSPAQMFMTEEGLENSFMRQVAQTTGGKAFVNTNALGRALPEAIANGANYYTIGYVPKNRKENGTLRHVLVKVEQAHDTLQYRRGYYAMSPKAMNRMLQGKVNPLIAAMQPGAPDLSQIQFWAKTAPASGRLLKVADQPGAGGALAGKLKNPQRFLVNYWINPRTLDLVTLPDGRRQVKLELTEVVFNRIGTLENYADTGIGVDLTPADAEKAMTDGIHLQQVIDVPKGRSMLRLGIRDIGSGSIGTLEFPVDVAKK